jgi:hypothetical protein
MAGAEPRRANALPRSPAPHATPAGQLRRTDPYAAPRLMLLDSCGQILWKPGSESRVDSQETVGQLGREGLLFLLQHSPPVLISAKT